MAQSAKERQKAVKAQIKAEKARKKASNDPADWGTIRQIKEAYKLTKEYDKALPWILLGGFVLPVLASGAFGLLVFQSWLWLLVGIPAGMIVAMLLLTRRTKAATYKRFDGQAGSAEVALGTLGKKWASTPAIAATKHKDVVHRAVGPAGIVLVAEGDPGRARQLLEAEARKHRQVGQDAPVTTVVMGKREGQVPLEKLAAHIAKMPKKLKKHEISEIKTRIRALDAVRPRAPLPKGPLPTHTKGARQAMRGR